MIKRSCGYAQSRTRHALIAPRREGQEWKKQSYGKHYHNLPRRCPLCGRCPPHDQPRWQTLLELEVVARNPRNIYAKGENILCRDARYYSLTAAQTTKVGFGAFRTSKDSWSKFFQTSSANNELRAQFVRLDRQQRLMERASHPFEVSPITTNITVFVRSGFLMFAVVLRGSLHGFDDKPESCKSQCPNSAAK